MIEVYINQEMGHSPHKKIQDMVDLIIVKGLPKFTLKLNFTFPIYTISKSTWLILQLSVITEDITIVTCIQYGLNLFNVASIRVFTNPLMSLIPPQATHLASPLYKNSFQFPSSNLLLTFSGLMATRVK